MGIGSADITNLKNDAAYNSYVTRQGQNAAGAAGTAGASTANAMKQDYTMFLQLMLTQLENQDPTSPMENTEWLSQLAQYSSLEQMTAMNSNMESISSSLQDLSANVGTNAVISQTLSLVGKDVTIKTETGNINGIVEEATFDGGVGFVKIGEEYYSIANITSIREAALADTWQQLI